MKGRGKPGPAKGKKFSLVGGTGAKQKPTKKRKQPTNNSRAEPDAKRPKTHEKEVVAGDEDRAFFEEHGQFLTFLDNMDTASMNSSKRKKKAYAEEEVSEDEGSDVEKQYERKQARQVQKKEETEKAPKRLPVLSEDNELMDVDVDSDEERAHEEERTKRAEEKVERLRQIAREKRAKRAAAIRAKKGLPPKEVHSEEESSEEDDDGSDAESVTSSISSASADSGAKNSTSNRRASSVAVEEDPDMVELQLFVDRQREVASIKEKLATLAGQILEDPEKNLRKLRDLHEFCDAEDITIRKLAIVSELKVFHDLIPSYRIVVGADAGVQLSKEVKKLREFETSILDCYQAYLTKLEEILKMTKEILKAKGEQAGMANAKRRGGNWKQKSYGKWRPSTVDISQMTAQGVEAMLGVGRVAAMAMGELLTKHHHFNFRANLIMTLVPLLNSADPELSSLVASSIRKLFETDSRGSSSLECARTISQLVKKKEFHVRPLVVQVLRSLRLRKPLEDGDSIFSNSKGDSDGKGGKGSGGPGGKKKHMSRKEEKEAKKDKMLEREMKETEAVDSKRDRDLLQTETLKVVFLLYFKILKNTKRSPLLPCVLEAMAHFAHLINLDLLLNLVEVLKEVIADKGIPLASSMHTVITAFQAIKLQGDTLTVDLKDFYTYFYPLLEPAMASPSQYSVIVPLLIKSLELMLTQRRILALDRVAAYAKRILTLSLHLPPQCILAILLVLNQIFRKYPKTQQMLDTEISGMGTYMPEVNDPEHCNAFAATAWEFSLLSEHVHPSVTNLARMVMNQDPITETNILKIFEQFDFAKNGVVPSMTKPRTHIFVKAMTKAKKAGKDNLYFVQPSEIFDETSFAKQLETSRAKLVARSASNQAQLFQQHYQDIQSLMAYDDDDIVSSDDEE